MRYYFLILFLIFSIFPVLDARAEDTNAGFVSSNIWYSKDPFTEGEKIKIYTFVFNPSERQLSGTVSFFDKTTLLGKKTFNVASNDVQDVSVDWTVTAGDHTIFAKIENAKFLVSAGKYEEVYLEKSESVKSKNTVSKKIIPQTREEAKDIEEDTGAISSIENIQNLIVEKTPDFIAKPVASAVTGLDNFRADSALKSFNKKEEVKKELESLKVQLEGGIDENPKSSAMKPFKYVALFFLTIFSYILNNQFLFYIILAIIVLMILRFIWRKIF